jgi:hypothetical protein
MKRFTAGLAAAAFLAVAGCQDLDTINTNNPDRDVALSRPSDVETLITSSWRAFYNSLHNDLQAYSLLPTYGAETVTGSNSWGIFSASQIPRPPFNNSALATADTDPRGVVQSWRAWHGVLASANEGLEQLDKGMKITVGTGANLVDNTARARAFALFTQGLAFGQLSMMFDQAALIDHTDLPLPGTPAGLRELITQRLSPYPQVLARSLQSFDQAIQVAQANNVRIPGAWLQMPADLTTAQFTQLINSYAARYTVYNARTPQERANVDWNKVLQYTANGLTYDFFPTLTAVSGGITSAMYFMAQNNALNCVTCLRANYAILGHADTSGRFQTWLSQDLQTREQFDIVTPDRRITGPAPTVRGAYFTHRPNNNGQGIAPGYMQSRYQFFRNNGFNNQGNAFLFSRFENNLLRAEALARTNQAAAAATLVNVSRTRDISIPGLGVGGAAQTFPGLPPVTASGVPASADCVPRTVAGVCGDLLLAIQYERMIEAFLADNTRAYADGRGWGRLPAGTALHFPVPGAELELLQRPVYTYGGVGGEWAAP